MSVSKSAGQANHPWRVIKYNTIL